MGASVGFLCAMAMILTVGSLLFGFWWAVGIVAVICGLTHFFGMREFKWKFARDLAFQMKIERARLDAEERARKSARWDE